MTFQVAKNLWVKQKQTLTLPGKQLVELETARDISSTVDCHKSLHYWLLMLPRIQSLTSP